MSSGGLPMTYFGPRGEGAPAEEPCGGGAARRGATAAAVGPGGGEGGAPAVGPGKAVKPQKIIQSPDRLYKAPERQ